MASNLRLVNDAIANLSVSYTAEAGGTITPTGTDINEIPTSVGAADAPIRLVGVTTEGGNTDTMDFSATTTNVEYTHSIVELCLIENVGLSRRMDELPDQQRYSDAILGALVSNRGIYTNCDITGAAATRRVYEWPPGSGEFWYGVLTTMAVREVAG
ncbi:hypothetical protein CMI37_14675 [Candidatus Pacearchaeota archaeon]|nr:hypothetical protein [Candidatus Pacearchaeota archaeon]|tara:strand:+ start:794 stop:1264 length:471 start_codon:yes stop_codon:yes gene_type:complete